MRPVLRALARQFDPLSDAALLERYARGRDPAAFEVLVWRHGAMVLGVCRRHLRDAHAAEDALQATFLILARKAATVRGDTLPGFLHRVARRVAVRAAAKVRRRRETPLDAEPAAKPSPDGELAGVLDAEIDGLPDRLRQVVVLCYLDGVSTADAAARLGVPRGTVLSRLAAARAKLAGRLTRRGVTPPAVGLTAVLTADAVAACVRLGEPGGAGANVGAATILANEVLAMSGRKTILAVAAGLVLAGGAGTGVGVLNAQQGEKAPAGGKPAAAPAQADLRAERLRRLDQYAPRVEEQLAVAQAKLQQLTVQTAELVDVTALQAGLAKIDAEILDAEVRVKGAANEVKQAEASLKSAATLTPAPEEVATAVSNNPQVKELTAEVRKLRERLDEIAQVTRSGSHQLADLKGKMDMAETRLAELRKKLHPEVTEQVRKQHAEHAQWFLAQQKREFATFEGMLAQVVARRVELVKRIADYRARYDQVRLAEDEVRVARELRQALMRLRLQTELGLDLPAPPPAADDRIDALARQIAELKASLAAPDGGSRLDAIEKKLDALKRP